MKLLIKQKIRNLCENKYAKRLILYTTIVVMLFLILGIGVYYQYFKPINMDNVESSMRHENLVLQLGNFDIANGGVYDIDVIIDNNTTLFDVDLHLVNKDIISAENIRISFAGMAPITIFYPTTENRYSNNILHLDSIGVHRIYDVNLLYSITQAHHTSNYTSITCSCDNQPLPFTCKINLIVNRDGTLNAYWKRMKSLFRSEIECEMYFNSMNRFVILSNSETDHQGGRSVKSKVLKTGYKNHEVQMFERNQLK